MAYIFTQGQCTKSQFYDTLLNLMAAAGWTNITSNYATDGDVMYSTGINGDKKLILNLIPYGGLSALSTVASAAADNARSLRTKTYCLWGYRAQQSYTPGSSGMAGTFSHPSRQFDHLYLFSGTNPGSNMNNGTYCNTELTAPLDTIINYIYYIDKSKVIIGTKGPDTYGPNWVFTYLGLPDTIYAKCDGGRAPIFATSCQFYGANQLWMTEYPDDGGSAPLTNNWYACDIRYIDTVVSPNQNNKYFLSPLYYSNSSYGIIGKLDGILGVYASNITTGDTITINGVTYTIFSALTPTQIYWPAGGYWIGVSNSFKYNAFAVRLS